MALNWSKDISFSGLKKSKSTSVAWPSKQHMDLMMADGGGFNVRKVVPVIVLVVLALVAFLKFGVFDMFASVENAKSTLASHQSALSTAQANLAKYDEVAAEYGGYEFVSAGDNGLVVDAVEVIDMIDKNVAPVARVSSHA